MAQFLGVATLVPDLVQQTLSFCLNGSLGAYSNGSYLPNVPSIFFTAMFLFWPGNSFYLEKLLGTSVNISLRKKSANKAGKKVKSLLSQRKNGVVIRNRNESDAMKKYEA